MDSETGKKVARIGAVIVLVAGAGYVIYTQSGALTPMPRPGQTLHNPFGEARAGGPAAAPGGAPPGGTIVPSPGTVDPKVGFGPSAGGPFRKR